MEEDIKILEEYIDFQKQWNLLNHEKALITAIENLIKGYRELEEENQKLIYELQEKDDEIRFANRDIKVFETDFIPKSKIKEKIEEYKKKIEEKPYDKPIIEIYIRVLQELMEDK